MVTIGDLCSQSVELFHRRVGRVPWRQELPSTNRRPHFNPRDRTAGGPKGFAAQPGTSDPFHHSVVLLDDIIKILRVTDNDRGLGCLVVAGDRCRVAATLIDRDLSRSGST